MSFLPSSEIEYKEAESSNQEYVDYLLDKNTMKFTAIGNQEESLRNWIEWAIKISRYKYEIFPFNYGNELYDELKGQSKSEEEIKDLVEYCIIDCLKVLQWIDEVEVRDIVVDGKKVSCRVIVKTIYGEEINNEYNI